MSSATCVFCGGGPTTKDHVWPDWVGKLIRDHTGVDSYPTTVGDKEWVSPRIDFQVKRVCEPCNSGWMSRMERTVQPFLGTMILGDPSSATLSTIQQRRLAAWAVKLALMLDFAHEKNPIIPPSEYEMFYKRRRPHSGMTVWLTAYSGSHWGAWAHRTSLHHRRRAFKAVLPAPEHENLYILTFTVFRVVFQVIHYFGGQGIKVEESWPWTQSLIPLWPRGNEPVVWPRNNLAFNDHELSLLATRKDFI